MGPLGSGSRVDGADRVSYQESGITPGFVRAKSGGAPSAFFLASYF